MVNVRIETQSLCETRIQMEVRSGKALGYRSLIFLLFLISIDGIALTENIIDYVVATVNDEAITRSALENESLLNHLLWKTDLEVQGIGSDSVIVLSGGDDYGLVANGVMEVLNRETRQQIAHIQIKQVDPRRATAVIFGSPAQTVNIGHIVRRPLLNVIKGLVLIDQKLVIPIMGVAPNNIIVLSGGDDHGLLPRDIVEVLDRGTQQQIAHARIKQVDPRRTTAVISGSPTQTVNVGHVVRRPLVESVLRNVRTVLNELIDRKLMMQEADKFGIPLARWKTKVDVELKATLGDEKLLQEINKKLSLETEEIREWLRTRLILNEFRDRRFGRVDNLEQQATEYLRHHPNEFYDQKLVRKRSFEEVLEEIQNRLRTQIAVDLEEWLTRQRNSSYIRKL